MEVGCFPIRFSTSRKRLATFLPSSGRHQRFERGMSVGMIDAVGLARGSAWSRAVNVAEVCKLSHMILAATSCTSACWDRPETCSRLRRCLCR